VSAFAFSYAANMALKAACKSRTGIHFPISNGGDNLLLQALQFYETGVCC
jgi:hypothetical protein